MKIVPLSLDIFGTKSKNIDPINACNQNIYEMKVTVILDNQHELHQKQQWSFDPHVLEIYKLHYIHFDNHSQSKK